jgi:hypothetical protein
MCAIMRDQCAIIVLYMQAQASLCVRAWLAIDEPTELHWNRLSKILFAFTLTAIIGWPHNSRVPCAKKTMRVNVGLVSRLSMVRFDSVHYRPSFIGRLFGRRFVKPVCDRLRYWSHMQREKNDQTINVRISLTTLHRIEARVAKANQIRAEDRARGRRDSEPANNSEFVRKAIDRWLEYLDDPRGFVLDHGLEEIRTECETILARAVHDDKARDVLKRLAKTAEPDFG